DLGSDEVLRDRREIVVDQLAIHAEAGVMPLRPELAAAANVGEDVNAALLEPQLATSRRIGGRLRALKPAISVDERRIVVIERHVAAIDDEIGDLGPVARGSLALIDGEARRIELRRLRHDLVRRTLG